jgi:hypothetical protein
MKIPKDKHNFTTIPVSWCFVRLNITFKLFMYKAYPYVTKRRTKSNGNNGLFCAALYFWWAANNFETYL